ncbi:PepSY domain-containing protein [Mucilaginibacter rubeus]|uniref:PepSY domain-containing protein n=1 Tax=Mucilaginibacter rubeus TaxID=2027860 RepID=A0AAE6MJH6_9SPHI|nr:MULTISPECIES: PepSY-associated TM helix domain-containing protein [Mucilaginibacter]QEM05765.1 PepSY domain-containing protein [Mucilaginibacter rubeus]QEM18351.1 PepSY domain-containing protein [Mucilaginibacter gossypii]QTE45113.1 PepSY domain-containing protein [Mucilaginibacter rubeus]QTE51710.1 PepSY domain-containing protein [Mucilaginibacter rubeus]QTE56796.1 PepSY domain-containing protein [Mucilaginibacter rubeus]
MKVFFRTIHLYLSLAAGVIIFCSCLTGTMLVFEKEIQQALHPRRYFVEPQEKRLPLANLTAGVLKQIPKSKLATVMAYDDPERAVEVALIVPEKKGKKPADAPKTEKHSGVHPKKDAKPKDAERSNLTAFVNPYTGQIVDQFNRRQTFLYSVEMFHRYLLGGKNSLGDWVISLSTLFFLVILVTGVILWWPKTKAIMKQRLKIKWNGSSKRLTHDVHIVTGFYTSIFLIIICASGLVMTFKWANNTLFFLTGSKVVAKEDIKAPLSVYQPGITAISPDAAVSVLGNKITDAENYTIRYPRDTAAVYTFNVLKKGSVELATDTYYVDQYSGKLAGSALYADKSLGQRIRGVIKPIHTGSIYGWPTQALAFLVTLISLIFPVTGVMMWLNRIRKKREKPVRGRMRVVSAEAKV